ncbi:MAG: hypothetical protein WD075_11375 [Rhodospirillales bacterium]
MSTALENLNLEEGKSEALRAALSCVAEASAFDGGPRYSEKVSRELARIIVCRSYAKPLLELSHLMVCASGRNGRFEDVFWGISRASSGEFRRSFVALNGLSENVRISANGIYHNDGADGFQISYARMPLLAALLEFMITTVGYPAIDDMTRPVRGQRVSSNDVLDAARAMQRSLYGYLKDHLPPVQRQRRVRHFLTFVGSHAGNRSGADAITDDIVLSYWSEFADTVEIEARTYRGVYETARRLIVTLDAAADRLASTGARSIGTDFEAGEIDPEDVEAVVSALDAGEGPLQRLLESCADRVKYINVNESEILAELPLNDSTARRIPISVLRNAIYGAVQLRLSMALRRGDDATQQPMPTAADRYYRARLATYAEVIDGTEKLALASLWVLHQGQRPEAVDLALQLAPDINWGVLSGHGDVAHEENVISLAASGAMKAFFRIIPDARGDELSALLADARKAWRQVNRAGFREESKADFMDTMAAAVPDVLRLIHAVRQLLDRDMKAIDWPEHEAADGIVFGAILGRLYNQSQEEREDAG